MPRPPHIERLVWDDWNRDHLTKHQVLPDEVEEVVAGASTSRETYKARLLVVGPTTSERMLAIVIGPVPGDPGAYYVFSARPASRKERAAYTQQKGGSA